MILVLCVLGISYNTLCQLSTTIIFQPDGTQGKDAYVHSIATNTNNGNSPLFSARAWTHSGALKLYRGYIDFDLSIIPSNATITDARLTLSPYQPANAGALVGDNEFTISEVMDPWDEHVITWANQPTNFGNQITMPASTNPADFQNIDVTAMIANRHANPNTTFGLQIQLVTEQINRAASFCSSDHADPNLRPRLEVTYVFSNRYNNCPTTCNYLSNHSFENGVSGNMWNHTNQSWNIECWTFAFGTPRTGANPTFPTDGTRNASMWARRENFGEGMMQTLTTHTVENGRQYVVSYDSRVDSTTLDPHTTELDHQFIVLTKSALSGLPTPWPVPPLFPTGGNPIDCIGPNRQCIYDSGTRTRFQPTERHQTCFTADDDYDQIVFFPFQDGLQNREIMLLYDNMNLMPLADAGEDTLACGKPVMLGPCDIIDPIPGATVTYSWTPTSGLDNPNVANPIATVANTTTYTLTATYTDADGNSCSDTDVVTVFGDEPQSIDIPVGPICINTPNVFMTVPDPANGTWSASCGNCIDPNTGQFFPNIAGLGTHHIFFNNLCHQTTDSIEVFPAYVCCLDSSEIDNAIILSGTYSQPLNVPNGSTVIVEDDVVFDNMNLNWTDAKVYVYGNGQGKSKIELLNTTAQFNNCNFEALCDSMWDGIHLQQNSKLQMFQTKVRDAYKGINVLSNILVEITIDQCDFSNNFYSIYFDNNPDVPYPVNITNSVFRSNVNQMKKPKEQHYTESHITFRYGVSNTFPLVFANNKVRNCKYGILGEQGAGLGMTIDQCNFINCFAGGVFSQTNIIPWHAGHALDHLILTNDCRIKMANAFPSIPQFANFHTSYGVKYSIGDLDFIQSKIVGAQNPFFNDIGISFDNAPGAIRVHESDFKFLNRAIELIAFGGEFVIYDGNGVNELKSRGTKIEIISNKFLNNNISILYRENDGPNNSTVTQITNVVDSNYPNPCPSCPQDNVSLIDQTISCNDFIRKDGGFGTAIEVEPHTLMNHIASCNDPAGNEIRTTGSSTMRSVWNDPLNQFFKYGDYANENMSQYPFMGVSYLGCSQVATNATCPGKPGILKRPETASIEEESAVEENGLVIYPNPSFSGIFNLTLDGFGHDKTICVKNIDGKTITNYTISSEQYTIDLSAYSNGMYFVHVSDGKNERVVKVIISQ